jgi:hypothetical protein
MPDWRTILWTMSYLTFRALDISSESNTDLKRRIGLLAVALDIPAAYVKDEYARWYNLVLDLEELGIKYRTDMQWGNRDVWLNKVLVEVSPTIADFENPRLSAACIQLLRWLPELRKEQANNN